MRLAHHIGYLLETGQKISYLRHSCNNPACVNPAHLIPGTHAENMKDVFQAGTHGNRKVDPEIAMELRKAGWTLVRIGAHFGASKQAAKSALLRKEKYDN